MRCLDAVAKSSRSDYEEEEKKEEYENQPSPTLQHLRKLLKDNSKRQENDPIISKLRDLVDNTPDHTSVENLLKRNEWARTSLMSIVFEDPDSDASTLGAAAAIASTAGGNVNLRDLLGARLRKINPKKWEESSMVSSTLACMTNLIDPGDLMKLRNLTTKPCLNGATVEIVAKSTEVGRWNVRILQRKHPWPGTEAANKSNDPDTIFTVKAEHLKHFV